MENKHSKLGIASFALSVLVGVLMLVVFAAAGVLYQQHHSGRGYPGQMLVGFAVIGLLFLDVAALGLGIASLTERATNKVFGILGLSFSALTILGTIGLMVFGLVYARAQAG